MGSGNGINSVRAAASDETGASGRCARKAVGTLALTFGIGAAALTGPVVGIAGADTTTAASDGASSGDNGAGSAAASTTESEGTEPEGTKPQGTETDDATDDDFASAETTAPNDAATLDTDADADADTDAEPVDTDRAPIAAAAHAGNSRNARDIELAVDTRRDITDAADDALDPDTPDIADLSISTTQTTESTVPAPPPAATGPNTAGAAEASTPLSKPATASVKVALATPPSLPDAPVPALPPETPLAWALLGWAGRETSRRLAADITTASAASAASAASPNQLPVAVGDAYGTNENTPVRGNVLTNDTDAEAAPLTAQLVAGAANGRVRLNRDGSFTYTPRANFAGSDVFSYRVSDGMSTSNTATVTVTVRPVNSAPIALPNLVVTREDNAAVANLLANDINTDGPDPLTAMLVSGPRKGTVNVASDGSFTYSPYADVSGLDYFTYRASDGVATSNLGIVVVGILPVADAPDAVVDTYTTRQGTTLTVPAATGLSANDSDPDSARLTTRLVTGPANGSLTVNSNGSFTYTPTAAFSGTDVFTYRVTDSTGLSDTATATIAVTASNTAPTAVTDAVRTDEDTPVSGSVLANDTDPDPGTTLTATLVAGPANGTLILNSNGLFTYTPAADFNGSDSFTYTASDDRETSNTATVSVTVTPVNDAPEFGEPPYTATTDRTTKQVTVSINASDRDGDPLTFTVTQPPARVGEVTFDADRNAFVFTPTAQAQLDAFLRQGPTATSFTVTADDGTVGTSTVVPVEIVGSAAAIRITFPLEGINPLDVAYPGGSSGGTAVVADDNGLVAVDTDSGNIQVIPVTVKPEALFVDRTSGFLDSVLATSSLEIVSSVIRIDTKTGTTDQLTTYPGGVFIDNASISSDGTLATSTDQGLRITLPDRSFTDVPGNYTTIISFNQQSGASTTPKVAATQGNILTLFGTTAAQSTVRSFSARTPRAAADAGFVETARIDLGGFATALEVSPDGSRIYAAVAQEGSGELVVISIGDDAPSVLSRTRLTDAPRSIAVSDDGEYLFVPEAATVSVIETQEFTRTEVLQTGVVDELVAAPAGGEVFAVNKAGARFTTIGVARRSLR